MTPVRSFAELECSVLGDVPTPALLVDEASVAANVRRMVRLLGSADRWRVHCKTARSAWAIGQLLAHGVRRFKTSTVTEVETVLRAGGRDVLYAVPTVAPAQHTLVRLAEAYPAARISLLADSIAAVETWEPGPVGVFLDVDTGMERTGVSADEPDEARAVLRSAERRGFECRGVHHYDGHLAEMPSLEQTIAVHRGLDRLMDLVTALDADLDEIVTGGTHTFLPSREYAFPEPLAELVTYGAGTVVYCDLRSLDRLRDPELRPAVGVLSRVVSASQQRITVDAGLTAIQVDAGTPHAAVVGHPGVAVGRPSQAHLPLDWRAEGSPAIGDLLTLIPRHVDTAVAQFDSFLALGENGAIRRHPMH